MSLSTLAGLIRNTLWNAVGRIANIAISLALTPYILGTLGQEAFGLWALSNLLLGYMSLADLGIQSSLVRQISYAQPDQNPVQLYRILSTSVLFYLGIFVVAAPAALWLGPQLLHFFAIPGGLTGDAVFVLTFVTATLFLSIALSVFASILPGVQRMDLANKIAIAVGVLNLVTVVIALEGGWGVRGLVVAALIVKILRAWVHFKASKRLFPQLSVSPRYFRWDVWKELFSFGWKIQISRLFEILMFSFDRFFLSIFGGMGALGRYQPSVQAATQARMAPHVLVLAALPYATELSAKKDRRALHALYLQGTLYLSFISFGLLGFVAATAPVLTTVWLGPGFSDVAFWIQIFSLGFLINAPLSLGGLVSQAIGSPGIQAKSAMIAAILNIILSPIGFFAAGVTGLTAGASVSIAIASVWFMQRLHRALGISTLRVLRESILSSALYLLVPAAGLAAVLHPFLYLVADRSNSFLALLLSGAAFILFAALGATRMDLWNVRKKLEETSPSTATFDS